VDIEAGLITKIVEGGKDALLQVMDDRIQAHFLSSYPDIFEDICKHFSKYKKVPEMATVLEGYPAFKPVETEEPLAYFVDTVKKRHKKNIYTEGVHKALQVFKSGDVDALEKELQQLLLRSRSEIKVSSDIDLRENVGARQNEYLSKKDCAGIDGYTTGWGYLDEMTTGLHGGDLVVYIAEAKHGKSWVLCNQALHIWETERVPVLMLTKEMRPQTIRKRVEAIHCRLPYDALRKGRLSEQQEKWYFSKLEELQNDEVPFVIMGYSLDDDGAGVSSIVPKVDRYLSNGGVLFVDGIYLMDDDRGAEDWRAIVNIGKDLKSLGMNYDIPVVASTQAQIQGKNYVPNMENIAYGKYLVQYVDALLSIAWSEQNRINDEAQVHLLAQRDGDVGMFMINFQFNPLDFSQKAVRMRDQDAEDDDWDEEDEAEIIGYRKRA
jgi:replicative DNA helicase